MSLRIGSYVELRHCFSADRNGLVEGTRGLVVGCLGDFAEVNGLSVYGPWFRCEFRTRGHLVMADASANVLRAVKLHERATWDGALDKTAYRPPMRLPMAKLRVRW